MKKKLLVAMCAFITVASMSAGGKDAYHVRIDNDTDGRQQATTVKANLILKKIDQKGFGRGVLSKETVEVKPDSEKNIGVPKGMHAIGVQVIGTKGAGVNQIARFSIPPRYRGKKIKVDVEFENGRLYLKLDRD